MKTKISSILTLAMLAFASLNLAAQTNPPAPPAITNLTGPQGSFFSAAAGFFTSFNPAYESTFQKTNEIDVWSGAENSQGQGISATLGIDYAITKSIEIESVTRNGDVGGSIIGEDIGIGYVKIVHDVKVEAFAIGGYDVLHHAPYGGVALQLKKALTDNTFMLLRATERVGGSLISKTPGFTVGFGFNF